MKPTVAQRRILTLLACSLVFGLSGQPGALAKLTRVPTDSAVSVAPGVLHREFVLYTSRGRVEGDILVVDLSNEHVELDLLYPGVVAARRAISQMADAQHAVAGINGDFYNINETNAPVGPAVANRTALKGAVPQGQRYGPSPPPGTTVEDVFGVGTNRVARVDQLTLKGEIRTPDRVLSLDGLNQYAIAEGGVGVFTPVWGSASRKRATCGTNTKRNAPCSKETAEVVVRNGIVTEIRAEPQAGPIPQGTMILVGREYGAEVLKQLELGDQVTVKPRLQSSAGQPFRFAIGGFPIVRVGQILRGLDDSTMHPRTSAGASIDGRTLYLVTVDGRQHDSVGMTLRQLAGLMRGIGAADAVNLDGGDSSTLVAREPGQEGVTVQNDPSAGIERPVPNGIGVFTDR